MPDIADGSRFRYDRADASPGLVLWRLTALWSERVASALKPFGLTQTQYAILASLCWFDEHGEPPTQRHVAEHTEIDKMTLSKAIRRLEAAGHVLRRSAPHDARAVEVRLTASGRQTVVRAIAAVEDADHAFFAVLDGGRLQTWLALSREVIAANPLPPPE